MQRVESYIEALSGRRLSTAIQAELIDYLDGIGRNKDFECWRYKQIIDALRILFCDIIQASWAEKVDWSQFMQDARQLPDHLPGILQRWVSLPVFKELYIFLMYIKFPAAL